MNPSTFSAGPRRLGGWGFQDQSFPPSEAMLSWLTHHIGPLQPTLPPVAEAPAIGPPRSLPQIGGQLSTEPLDRVAHAAGQGLPDILRWRDPIQLRPPDAVHYPTNARDVEALLEICSRHQLQVIPWGGGTSVTGGVTVVASDQPVITMDLRAMAHLEAMDTTSGLATIQAGATGPQVEAMLHEHGFTLGHFPQSWELATLGGWIVTRSSGQESAGYGRIEDMVAGLELVAPAGRLSLPALPASAAGPDLRQLVLGSEGRLGVVTNATVRVRPRPETHVVEGFLFPDWQLGVAAARSVAQSGLAICMLRLSDAPETEVAMAVGLGHSRWQPLIRRWLSLRGVDNGCLMLIGANGSPAVASRTMGAVRSLLRSHRAVRLGRKPGRNWLADRFRHPYLRDALLENGVATDTLETAAPWSRLHAVRDTVRSALLEGLPSSAGERVAVLCHVSHPYPDGASLYFTFFFRCGASPAATIERWARLKRSATDAIVSQRAALSHHHGVGVWHAPWLSQETGADGHRLLTTLAAEMDPSNTLNPGVLLDPLDRLEL